MNRLFLSLVLLSLSACGTGRDDALSDGSGAQNTAKAGELAAATLPLPVNCTKFTSLHDFVGNFDDGAIGNNTPGRLVLVDSTFYGMTPQGGGMGTIFRIDADGGKFAIIHRFQGMAENDGVAPVRSFLAYDGTALYGMMRGHEAYSRGGVFRIVSNGLEYRSLRDFTRSTDGLVTATEGGLTLCGSTLYGTSQLTRTNRSGKLDCYGTVFCLDTDGSNFKVLHEFLGGSDGNDPTGELLLAGKALYGTTGSGGGAGGGTVFRTSKDGSGYTILHRFQGSPGDGCHPLGGLTLVANKLYGTTERGGDANGGAIFCLDLDGKHFRVIYSFPLAAGLPHGTLASRGSKLYGTKVGGTIFSVNTDGSGYQVLYSAQSNGDTVFGPFTVVGDYLYGMNSSGSRGRGQIFVLPLEKAGGRGGK